MGSEWIKVKVSSVNDLIDFIEEYLEEKNWKYKISKFTAIRDENLKIINIKAGLFKKIIIHAHPKCCYVNLSGKLADLKRKLEDYSRKFKSKVEIPSKLEKEIECKELMLRAWMYDLKSKNAKVGLLFAISAMLATLPYIGPLSILFLLSILPIPIGPKGRPFETWGSGLFYFKYRRLAREYLYEALKLKEQLEGE